MIDYTFSITSGAGGFAISPQLTIVRVVRWDSPAFLQVQQLFANLLVGSEREMVQAPKYMIKKLHRLFCTGVASPFDVDQDGRTLLHVSHS